jgi:hypothetical protein
MVKLFEISDWYEERKELVLKLLTLWLNKLRELYSQYK